MNKVALLAGVLACCAPAACSQSDNARTARPSSAAAYYGPSAMSYAPDFSNTTPGKPVSATR